MVIPSGFEPETHSLEGCCSIQLSYGTPFFVRFAFCESDATKTTAKLAIFCETAKFYAVNLM